MDVSTVGNGVAATGVDRFSQMSSEDFIKVMFTELRNQDPLSPNDSQALLDQLSSLRNIESQMALQTDLKTLVTQNQVASAGNLIGKTVAGIDGFNNQTVGVVTSVRVADDQVILELDNGIALPMDRVTHIADSAGGGNAQAEAQSAALNAQQQTNTTLGNTNSLLTDLIRQLTGAGSSTGSSADAGDATESSAEGEAA